MNIIKREKESRNNTIYNNITINFGKVDGYHKGRKNCSVEVTVSLSEDGRFSAMAFLYNHMHTDCIMGGQCLDTLAKEFPELMEDSDFAFIYDMWKKYHLNDMKAGSPNQQKFIKENKSSIDELCKEGLSFYDAAKKLLTENDLYEDKDYLHPYTKRVGEEFQTEKKPYRYGSAWLKEDIPNADLNQIKKIFVA